MAASAYGLFFVENGLVSLMAARAIYETVAVFLEFERQFAAIVKTRTLQEIMEFVQKKAFATRSKKMIAKHGEYLKARSIQTDIQKLSSVRKKAEEEWSFLSEHTHPAGFGTLLYFAEKLKVEDAYIFRDGGPDPHADLQWILASIKLLEDFETALDRVEAALPALSARGQAEKPKQA